MFKRKCPTCHVELTYTQKHNWVTTEKKNGKCRRCRKVTRHGEIVECIICRKQIYRRPSDLRNDGRYFCSFKCHRKYTSIYCKGENNKLWKGGREKSRRRFVEASNRRRFENKERAIRLLGGKCSKCGYSNCLDAIEFHHINEEEKDASICEILDLIWGKKIEKELEKCKLLCSNCHREHHWSERVKTRLTSRQESV